MRARHYPSETMKHRRNISTVALVGAGFLAAAAVNLPAAAAVVGTLGNFDVVNDTGKVAHGFEIDLEGLNSSNVTDTFGGAGRYFPPTVERYGSPVVSNTANGVSIVYSGSFSGGSWNVGTPSGPYTTPGESCWTGGGSGYGPGTPCDHFGVGTNKNPTKTTYSWLTETSSHSSVLTPVVATLPAPILTVIPPLPPAPGQPPAPAVVVGQVQSPPPPADQSEPQFGTPQWVKVFTTQYDKPVALENLVGGNGIVPQSKAETEIEWQLLQTDPGNPLAGQIENSGDVGANAESVLRRYEFYKYVGPVDPASGEVSSDTPILDANGNPVSPLNGGNIGSFVGAQNNALNLNGVYLGLPAGAVAAPEPMSLSLLATGVIGLATLRRRFRKT